VYAQCIMEIHSDLYVLDSSQMVIQFDPHWVTLLLMFLFTKVDRLHNAVVVIMLLIMVSQ